MTPAGAIARQVAKRSKRIQALPVATQRQIQKSCGALTLAAPAGADTTATGTDIGPGSYVVVNAPMGAPLRGEASIHGAVLDTLPEGTGVTATGENNNFFARIQIQNAAASTGWISALMLAPLGGVSGSGALALTPAQTLQLRTILAGWSQHNPTEPVYGVLATDFDTSPAADGRQAIIVQAFQKARGGLRTDGIVDGATFEAAVQWAQGALANTPPAANPLGGPFPGQAFPGPTPTAPSSAPSPVLPLIAIAGLLFLLIQEEKKKRRKAA